MNQPLSADQELQRAHAAQQILRAEMFIEACQQIEQGLALQRARVPMRETDMHTKLIIAEQLWGQLKDYLQQVADTGEFARFAIEAEARKKSMLERILSGSLRENS